MWCTTAIKQARKKQQIASVCTSTRSILLARFPHLFIHHRLLSNMANTYITMSSLRWKWSEGPMICKAMLVGVAVWHLLVNSTEQSLPSFLNLWDAVKLLQLLASRIPFKFRFYSVAAGQRYRATDLLLQEAGKSLGLAAAVVVFRLLQTTHNAKSNGERLHCSGSCRRCKTQF